MTRATLTPRQSEALDLWLEGHGIDEVAQGMVLRRRSARNYLHQAMVLYGARDLHELTCIVWRQRLLDARKEWAERERQRAVLARDLAREKARGRVV